MPLLPRVDGRDWQDEIGYQKRLSATESEATKSLFLLEVSVLYFSYSLCGLIFIGQPLPSISLLILAINEK